MNDHIPPHRPQLQATVVPVQEYNKWPIDWNSLSTGKKKIHCFETPRWPLGCNGLTFSERIYTYNKQ